MKLIDKLKIAVHSLMNNKTRSIITIIIVFIVSMLILSIMIIAINFSQNQNDIQRKYIDATSATINISKGKKTQDGYGYENVPLSDKEIEKILETTQKYEAICNRVSARLYANNLFSPQFNYEIDNRNILYTSNPMYFNTSYLSFLYPLGIDGIIAEGRIWTKDDVGKKNVWVTSQFISASSEKGLNLTIGDEIWLHFLFYDSSSSREELFSKNFIIQGIISSDVLYEYQKEQQYFEHANSDIFLDISYAMSIIDFSKSSSYGLNIEYTPPKTQYNFNEMYKMTESLVKEIEGIVEIPNSSYRLYIYSTIIESLKVARILSIFIILLASILSIIILALSIGSVANTIIISVDKNKKFIGLMKALGLKQKDVESIVKIEAIITIVIGITFSTFLILSIFPFFNSIISSIINGIFSYELLYIEYDIKTFLPVYLPIATIFVFLLMAFLFSRSSLRSISQMDVITIISEVS